MAFSLGRSLLLAKCVTADQLAHALSTSLEQRVHVCRALIGSGELSSDALERHLFRTYGSGLAEVAPESDLGETIPPGLCELLLAWPVGWGGEGTALVATVDPTDTHVAREFERLLGADVHLVRAEYGALERLLSPVGKRPVGGDDNPSSGRITRTPAWGTIPSHRGDVPGVRRPRAAGLSLTIDGRSERQTIPATPHESEPMRPNPSSIPIPLLRRDPIPNSDGPNADGDDGEDRPQTLPAPSEPAAREETRLPLRDIHPVVAAMRASDDRDAIIALLLSGVHTAARRVAILVVKRTSFVGWSCTSEFGDRNLLRLVEIPSDAPSILASAASVGTYLGPLFRSDAHAPLLAVMGHSSRDVAIAPVFVRQKAALLLIADELYDTMLGTKRMEELSREAGEALERVLMAKR